MQQVAEFATQFFITDNKCNCAGLVLAGSAEFKNELQVRRALLSEEQRFQFVARAHVVVVAYLLVVQVLLTAVYRGRVFALLRWSSPSLKSNGLSS